MTSDDFIAGFKAGLFLGDTVPVECWHCVYWTTVNRTDVEGRCHRHAPGPLPRGPSDHSVWPKTYRTDGCGEGRKRIPNGK